MKLNLPKFLFINGPAGSGKSTLAELICRAEPSAWRESFAEPIRQMIWAVFYPNNDPLAPQPNLREQSVKARPIPFPSTTPPFTHREEMIAFSEHYMKTRHGQDIFGKLLMSRCEAQSFWYSHFIIDDSGFQPEALHVISLAGKDNCHLIRLHRRGCDFGGDSRSYISLPGVQTLDLHNDGPPDEMLHMLQLEFGTL